MEELYLLVMGLEAVPIIRIALSEAGFDVNQVNPVIVGKLGNLKLLTIILRGEEPLVELRRKVMSALGAEHTRLVVLQPYGELDKLFVLNRPSLNFTNQTRPSVRILERR